MNIDRPTAAEIVTALLDQAAEGLDLRSRDGRADFRLAFFRATSATRVALLRDGAEEIGVRESSPTRAGVQLQIVERYLEIHRAYRARKPLA